MYRTRRLTDQFIKRPSISSDTKQAVRREFNLIQNTPLDAEDNRRADDCPVNVCDEILACVDESSCVTKAACFLRKQVYRHVSSKCRAEIGQTMAAHDSSRQTATSRNVSLVCDSSPTSFRDQSMCDW
eukprot:SAG31_NODE_513_length_14715_cov_22.844554_6_plen_128_part_00